MSATDPHQVIHRTIETVWRIETTCVIAGLTRGLDLAEDLAQEAFVATLEEWPQYAGDYDQHRRCLCA